MKTKTDNSLPAAWAPSLPAVLVVSWAGASDECFGIHLNNQNQSQVRANSLSIPISEPKSQLLPLQQEGQPHSPAGSGINNIFATHIFNKESIHSSKYKSVRK